MIQWFDDSTILFIIIRRESSYMLARSHVSHAAFAALANGRNFTLSARKSRVDDIASAKKGSITKFHSIPRNWVLCRASGRFIGFLNFQPPPDISHPIMLLLAYPTPSCCFWPIPSPLAPLTKIQSRGLATPKRLCLSISPSQGLLVCPPITEKSTSHPRMAYGQQPVALLN